MSASIEKEQSQSETIIEERDAESDHPVDDEPENDRHSDIEIIQPNADPLPVGVGNHPDISGLQGHIQDMSANEDKMTENEISTDEIKISRETMLKMMMEINQLKQAHIARENSEQKKSDEVNISKLLTIFTQYKRLEEHLACFYSTKRHFG